MSASSHGTRLLRTETFNVHHQQTSENSGETVAQLKSRTVHRIPTEITPARHCDRRKMFTDEPCIVYHDVCQVVRIDRWRPIRVYGCTCGCVNQHADQDVEHLAVASLILDIVSLLSRVRVLHCISVRTPMSGDNKGWMILNVLFFPWPSFGEVCLSVVSNEKRGA